MFCVQFHSPPKHYRTQAFTDSPLSTQKCETGSLNRYKEGQSQFILIDLQLVCLSITRNDCVGDGTNLTHVRIYALLNKNILIQSPLF